MLPRLMLRVSMVHMLPSVVGNNSAHRDLLTFEAVLPASRMTPFYSLDLALPRRHRRLGPRMSTPTLIGQVARLQALHGLTVALPALAS